MGGPQTVKTLNELWKELERVNSQVEGGRWNNQSKNDEEANVRPLAVDIEEDDDGYTLTADVPGLSKEDLKVQVDKDRFLTISGERKRVEADGKEDSKYKERSQYERKFGKFSRKLKLPDDADMECISARVDAGVLYLSIRRAEDLKPVDVPIY
jgi:HSP20 family protein